MRLYYYIAPIGSNKGLRFSIIAPYYTAIAAGRVFIVNNYLAIIY